ncbi:DUF2147 domain-containing protein [Psychrobacter sp. FDAARGOS_221]|uniref:DUF2147 domain-containing protein n=1 Tax=Psychrobacter sp. FDAARGOS_221 TaxID=1975705 RepID=UPI000BB56DAA|nr:DUF2147 domain-containing protein [Psychrobacter sp. FDAARGOS_221]PNK60242.1 DUF2147 domain-containing protein [Psychrobacter sp. FDAARGOS_221]
MNMFAKSLLLTTGLAFSMVASAADQLNNTKWTTYNDKGQPDSVLQFTESNGKLSAKIVKILDPRAAGKSVCDTCKGKFKNKPLTGATVLWDLKADPKNPNKYIDGKGIEPESGMTFSGKGELKGNTLELRGYKGISFLGKTRILKRRN